MWVRDKQRFIRQIKRMEHTKGKQALRQTMRLLRKRLAEKSGERSSQYLSNHLWEVWSMKGRPLIALYHAMGSEVSLLPFIERAEAEGECVCWPRVHPDGHMDFAQAQLGELMADAKDIPAPPLDLPSVYPQMIVVPGLAFDRWGRRLGQGGGYYDKTLSQYPNALWVGAGFEVQVASRLQTEVHDQRMHALVTEREFRLMPIFKPRKRLGKGC